MNPITRGWQKVFCLIFCLVLLCVGAASAEPTLTADPATLDSWSAYIGPNASGELDTEYVGSVWTDKTVLKDALKPQNSSISITPGDNHFLVALSAVGATSEIQGSTTVPVDTVLVLDVSGSMNSTHKNVAQQLVTSANQTVKSLLAMNPLNRVGVVLYSSSATELLPLDHYTTAADGVYFNYTTSDSKEYIAVDGSVRNSSNQDVSTDSRQFTGGTYMQRGIYRGMQMLANATTTVVDPQLGTLSRRPVMILMTDGAPTYGHTSFSSPASKYNFGNGSQSTSALGFVTQLTAAYAKQQLQAHYGSEPLIYTVGLQVGETGLARSVLDPAKSTADLNEFWTEYQALITDQQLTVQAEDDSSKDKKVTKISTELKQQYVNQFFHASSGSDMVDQFESIVSQIKLQAAYHPTLVQGSAELSGYVSFVDRIGPYMEVKKVHGIAIGGVLHTGEMLAENFVEGGKNLGSAVAPTPLGTELVNSIKERLGISDDQVGALLSLAHRYGQLSYDETTGAFSNYVGWYANGDGHICGFWHEGDATPPANAKYAIKSYTYLGDATASGVQPSDMMYTTVRVQKDLKSGEELVSFAVPAALLPLHTYQIKLDSDNEIEALTLDGNTRPIRLIYEVGLRDDINEHNLTSVVDSNYLQQNTDENGVHFYTNQYEKDGAVGYGKTNTYSYFRPSRQNDRYYYLKDTPVMVRQSDGSYAQYNGNAKPAAGVTYYRKHTIYETDAATGAHTHVGYHELAADVLPYTRQDDSGCWYIPAGTVHMNMHDFDVEKQDNPTGTLPDVNKPYLDVQNANDPSTYRYVVGSTLGNNGRLSMPSRAGIVIRKTVEDADASATDDFIIRLASSNPNDADTYEAHTVHADGSSETEDLQFTAGNASLTIRHGDTVYVNGLPADKTYTLTEEETAKHKLVSINGDASRTSIALTPSATKAPEAHFVNALRGTGSLTLTKLVDHPFGTKYVVPKTFTIHVDLNGIGTASKRFEAAGEEDYVTTDADGKFTLTLGHEEQVTLSGLPAGTTAIVTEADPDKGFLAPVYIENGVENANAVQGQVTVVKNDLCSVTVKNTYQPDPASGEGIQARAQKLLKDADGNPANWENNYEFTFELQQRVGETFTKLGDATATNGNAVQLADAFENVSYQAAGEYYYRFIENTSPPIDNIVYDHTVHDFVVVVDDADMDGALEIAKISSERDTVKPHQDAQNNWTVTATFTNHVGDIAEATIPIQKRVTNHSGSSLAQSAGFTFALYSDEACATTPVKVSEPTNSDGFTSMVLTYKAKDQKVSTTEHYWLKEIPQNQNAWKYDSQVIPITIQVVVTPNASGTANNIEAFIWEGHSTTKPAGATASLRELSFTNVYDPADVEWMLDVKKTLENQTLQAGMFTFRLTDENGSLVHEARNDANGSVAFDSITFDKVGQYHYFVQEVDKGNGYITDDNVYRVLVDVKDVGGQLVATHTVLNMAEDDITFTNVYDPQDVTHTIRGSKVLTGRPMLNDEFDFVLCELDEQGNATELQTVGNTLQGTFAFDPITYTLPGVHRYTVHEVVDDHREKHQGMRYDSTVFNVTVTVTDNGRGELQVDERLSTENSSASEILFTNQYIPTPTTAVISGEKNLRGLTLQPGQFTFRLYEADENCTPIKLLDVQKNDASGQFSFEEIEYTGAGKWHYVVKEEGGGQIIEGITYDGMDYHVTVDVTDNGLGQLSTAVVAHDQYHIPQTGVEFINTFGTLGDSKIILQGSKMLNGRNLQDGEFTFELYETAADYVVPEGAQPFMTAQNQQGQFVFELDYEGAADNQVFYYVLREQNAGEMVNNVTYSEQEYHIMVEVEETRGSDGLLETITVIRTEGEATLNITFTNEYTAPNTPAPPTGDRSTPALWLALMIVSTLLTTASTRKRKAKEG